MFCRMCGEQIPDNSEICPVCGEEQHIRTTGETEKSEETGKTPVKILKGAGKAIATVGGSILIAVGPAVAAVASEEVGKALQKKLKKGVSTAMKATGLKNKTLFDKAGDAAKAWQKKRRK
ncbi:MAG: zinc ribbon domain-containing protein [Lachnospiraceae bacterium]|jgi:uncharacterized membrane protein YvbJ|nr:zinc-ribbon domain-containing protein [uncultured Acetatifactor sp.]MCI9571258.1 zinc ribbon domain-containing protein [Lachnospiraceae bacterium]